MIRPGERLHSILSGLFMLALVCTGLVALRFGPWEGFLALCCEGMIHREATIASIGSTLLYLIVVGLPGVGLWKITEQVWRTSQHMRELQACAVDLDPPSHVTARISELQPGGQVVLIRSAQPLAFCVGFLRPRICVSTGLVELLTPVQLKAVLLHEEHHRQRRDPLRLAVAESAAAMFFFLPAVREWSGLFKIQVELAADRRAMSCAGKPALAGALYRMLGHSSPPVATDRIAIAGLSVNAARVAELLGDETIPTRVSPQSLQYSTLAICLICVLLMI